MDWNEQNPAPPPAPREPIPPLAFALAALAIVAATGITIAVMLLRSAGDAPQPPAREKPAPPDPRIAQLAALAERVEKQQRESQTVEEKNLESYFEHADATLAEQFAAAKERIAAADESVLIDRIVADDAQFEDDPSKRQEGSPDSEQLLALAVDADYSRDRQEFCGGNIGIYLDLHGSFGQRTGGGRKLLLKRYGGTKATEHSVDSALRWLAYHQETDGHWDAKKYAAGEKTDTAVTGLALLAFLAGGHTEKWGEYRGSVKRAVAWLISKQDARGLIWDETDAGGHRGVGYPGAIATQALAEAAGMARVPATKAAAQKAINYCTEVHQCGDGEVKGGWRYHAKQEADTSVSGWFIMALKSAKIAGLKVNPASYDGAIRFLDSVEHKEGPAYGQASIYWYKTNDEHEGSWHRLTAIAVNSRKVLF
jgi:hypothetical protein